jgi:uncharacterized protein
LHTVWQIRVQRQMLTSPSAEFVVKITKYCNLRCSYCYEFPDLGKKERMSLDSIARMFTNIFREANEKRMESLRFIWHGGEPFLIPIDYYQAIAGLQREVFTDKVHVTNVVQTNLTVLTDRHVEFLKSGFFSSLGVSFDVYGNQRVDVRGRQSTETVLANMQKLTDNKIDFGVITVLARNTLPHVQNIYRFFDKLHRGIRFLPFYLNANGEEIAERQIADHALTHAELVGAFKQIFDEWLVSKNAVTVDPIDGFIDAAVSYVSGLPGPSHWLSENEVVFVVNVDGRVWSAGEAYGAGKDFGNLFNEDFGVVLNSPGRRRILDDARTRIARHCGSCPYFGACPGHFVGDASPQQQRMLAESGCPVRDMIGYIVEKFERTGLSDVIAERAGQRRQEPKTHLVSL